MSLANAPTQESDLSAKAKTLAEYLRKEARDSEIYVKSRFIADDVDLSAKEIGAAMIQLQAAVSDLTIEKWSYTSGTTWRVTVEE